MRLPRWSELNEQERQSLISLAGSHGVSMDDEHFTVDGLILPDQKEAYGLAVELYEMSRVIMHRRNQDATPHV